MNKPILIGLEQGSKEWLETRRNKLGASDTSAILGLDPWTTRLMKWEEKVLGKEKTKTFAMERGTAKEDICRRLYNEKMGTNFEPRIYEHPIHSFMWASCDGVMDIGDQLAIIEIKCPMKSSYEMMVEHGIPKHYELQAQKQMLVTNASEVDFLIFDGEKNWETERIYRDEVMINKIIEEELKFWDSIVNFIPPQATDKDWVSIYEPELSEKADRYRQLSNLIDELETERAAIKLTLTTEINHNRAKIGDLKLQRVISIGRVNYDKLIEDYEIDEGVLTSYRKKPTESWRLTLD